MGKPHWRQAILILLLTLAVSGCALQAQPTPPSRITVQLSFMHQAEFAGLYAAEQKGYFAAEGLKVAFLEGVYATISS